MWLPFTSMVPLVGDTSIPQSGHVQRTALLGGAGATTPAACCRTSLGGRYPRTPSPSGHRRLLHARGCRPRAQQLGRRPRAPPPCGHRRLCHARGHHRHALQERLPVPPCPANTPLCNAGGPPHPPPAVALSWGDPPARRPPPIAHGHRRWLHVRRHRTAPSAGTSSCAASAGDAVLPAPLAAPPLPLPCRNALLPAPLAVPPPPLSCPLHSRCHRYRSPPLASGHHRWLPSRCHRYRLHAMHSVLQLSSTPSAPAGSYSPPTSFAACGKSMASCGFTRASCAVQSTASTHTRASCSRERSPSDAAPLCAARSRKGVAS